MRAREYFSIGILRPGKLNAITDVAGVRVGHSSLQSGSLQTGVTAILPHGRNLYREKPAAACAILNGYGKSVGVMQIEELGTIETPILITSTLNVPRVADALISAMLAEDEKIGLDGDGNSTRCSRQRRREAGTVTSCPRCRSSKC